MSRNSVRKIKDRLNKRLSNPQFGDQTSFKGTDPNPTDTAKLNYTAYGMGNDKGSIMFGQIHEKGDVTSGVMLRTPDGKHMMSMDIDDQRKGWTTFTGPGNFTVECGDGAQKDPETQKYKSTMMLNAKKGDIHIIATDGDILLEADNIRFVARGEGGSSGNIECVATESFTIHDTKKILMDCSMQFKMTTSGDAYLAANGMLGLYGSLIKGVSDACSEKASKNSNQIIQKRFTVGGLSLIHI